MNKKNLNEDFFSGKLPIDAAKDHMEWLMSESSNQELEELIKQTWEEKYHDQNWSYDSAQTLNAVKAKITFIPQRRNNLRPIRWYLAAAATVILAAVLITYLGNEVVVIPQQEWVVKENPAGQKSRIHLPDGSFVNLNAGSYLKYAEDFNNNRSIELIGEAFFEVQKRPDFPFKVTSKGVVTTALGTSFNIKAYKETDMVEVALSTGKVSVEDTFSKNKLLLLPGQMATKLDASAELIMSEMDINTIGLWRNGVLQFDNTPLADVINSLENWYNVEITIIGNVSGILCVGTFDNEYLDNVLDVLSHTIGFEFQINNKNVTINLQTKAPMKQKNRVKTR